MCCKRINTLDYIFVLLIAVSLWAFPFEACGELSFYQDSHGPAEKIIYAPAKFSYSQKNDLHLANFQGKAIRRALENDKEELFVDLKVDYGQLFLPSNYGYLGVGYFTAKVDTDNRIRFNSSLGRFLPVVDGEFFLTYRFLYDNISSSLQNVGLVDGNVYENSFSANYTRFSKGFIRETSLNYSFSTIPGQEFAGSVITHDPEDSGYTARISGGFGETTTHEIAGEIAFGSENIDIDFLSGFKTSIHFGYEYVEHEAFHNQPGQSMNSFSALATVEQQISAGLMKASYRYLESSRTLYAGYFVRGVELYFKNTQYKDQDATQLFGFKMKFDLNTLSLPFRKKAKSLFRKAMYSYKGLDRIRHNASINSDHFASQPYMQESIIGSL